MKRLVRTGAGLLAATLLAGVAAAQEQRAPAEEAPSPPTEQAEAPATERAPPPAPEQAQPPALHQAQPPAPEQAQPPAPEAADVAAAERRVERPPERGAEAPTLSGGTIAGAKISGARISGARIVASTVTDSTIDRSTIEGSTLVESTVTGSTLSGTTIEGGTVSGSTVSATPSPAARRAPQGDAPGAAAQPAPAAPAQPAQGGAVPGPREGAPAAGGERPQPPQRAAATGDGDEDEEDVAARALQRSLVQRGALLLPVWGFEIVLGASYGHSGEDTSVLGAGPGGAPATLPLRSRSHQLSGVLTSRVGLPWELQLEASVPVLHTWNDVVVAGTAPDDASGGGVGDPRLSVTRQLLRARGALPDLLLAATWKPRVASSPFDAAAGDVALGSGFEAVGGTLTAAKTLDPLVLLASASYTANLAVRTDRGRRDPGDTFGLGAGAILAVSPETSMSFLLDASRRPADRLDGAALPGSDETVAVLQLGVATVLSRRALLNFTVGVGLTPDSPDLALGVSLPLRFF